MNPRKSLIESPTIGFFYKSIAFVTLALFPSLAWGEERDVVVGADYALEGLSAVSGGAEMVVGLALPLTPASALFLAKGGCDFSIAISNIDRLDHGEKPVSHSCISTMALLAGLKSGLVTSPVGLQTLGAVADVVDAGVTLAIPVAGVANAVKALYLPAVAFRAVYDTVQTERAVYTTAQANSAATPASSEKSD